MNAVTFFSYKGGAGRSTLCLNEIPFLVDELFANEERPIILCDLDIDSAGMTYLLDKQNDASLKLNTQSILGVNRDYKNRNDFFNLCWPVGDKFGFKEGTVLFVPAVDGKTIEGNTTNFDSNSDRINKLDNFVKYCEAFGAAAVVFDSAVGDQITAQIANSIADVIVCVMRPTLQFRQGTRRYLNRLETGGMGKNIIIVPNVVPTEEIELDGINYPSGAKEILEKEFGSLNQQCNTYNMDMISDDCPGIPMVQSFMWKESILSNKGNCDLTENEREALRKYKKLANIIANMDMDL